MRVEEYLHFWLNHFWQVGEASHSVGSYTDGYRALRRIFFCV